MLATGYPGPGIVPHFLAAHFTLPDIGVCGGWSFGVVERDYNVAGEGFEGEIISQIANIVIIENPKLTFLDVYQDNQSYSDLVFEFSLCQ